MSPEKANISAIEIQNPLGLEVNGISGMFWPKMLAINVGGIKMTETMVKIFMILFCSTLTKPMKISCMLFNRSKLNFVCSINEVTSLRMMVSLEVSSVGISSLLSRLESVRCFSMMFWPDLHICS